MKDISKAIDRFPEVRILVVGDLLLDQFVFGEISRVSREAPVLILRYRETHSVPGGCANTVANVESLGAEVIPVGFLGDDEFSDQLLSLWPRRIETGYVFRDRDFRTTRKARILAGSHYSFRQQVVRMDYEHPCRLDEQHEHKLIQAIVELIPQVDAVILSDYSLGNLTKSVREAALKHATQHQKILVADSRDNPQLYQGATSITPNISEIEKAASISTEHELGRFEETVSELRRQWRLEALLVTRGKLGMSLFAEDSITHIPVFGTDEVADVTGAGDTVTAVYTTALAAGCSFEQAARLANYAGGTVVMKKGTAIISPSELRQALRSDL